MWLSQVWHGVIYVHLFIKEMNEVKNRVLPIKLRGKLSNILLTKKIYSMQRLNEERWLITLETLRLTN